MSYAMMVRESVSEYSKLEIIDSHTLYKEKFDNISEKAYYKTFSRMSKSGEVKRLAKGVYCRPKKSRFGLIISDEKNILEYYLGPKKRSGVVIGYRMYNRYKLTTQVSKNIEIYSNVTLQEEKHIKNVKILRADLEFDEPMIHLIELLEVLENYKNIEDLNYNNLIQMIETSASNYNDRNLNQLINIIKYKKRTLASLKNVLDYYGIENKIDKYLNETSNYDAFNMEALNEVTSQQKRL